VHTSEAWDNFWEWVTVNIKGNETTVSSEVAWSYTSWVDLDNSVVNLNQVQVGHIALPQAPHYEKRPKE